MRAVLRFALMLVALGAPGLAHAEGASADEAESAFRIFAGGLSQNDFLAARIGNKLFDGIAGQWVRLGGPDPKSGIESYGADIEKFCKSNGAVTLASPSALVMTLTTNLPKVNFTQTYTLVGGSSFAEHTDPESYFAAIGLGPEITGETADAQRAALLARANGRVQLFRPSPNILVMTREGGYPLVLARCPGV